jgi:uncharacterized protein YjeT (DUF2065 family)
MLLWGFAMALVLEGALYALFAKTMHKALSRWHEIPPDHLRIGGTIGMGLGIAALYVLKAMA